MRIVTVPVWKQDLTSFAEFFDRFHAKVAELLIQAAPAEDDSESQETIQVRTLLICCVPVVIVKLWLMPIDAPGIPASASACT